MIRAMISFKSLLNKQLFLTISVLHIFIVFYGCTERQESSHQQLRSISAMYDELGKAVERFNTQHKDIVEQHNLFKRKNSEYGYIGTQHARRIALQELRDINANVIRQCNFQKEWCLELATHGQTQIRSVSWNNDKDRRLAEAKFQNIIEPIQKKMPSIEQCLQYHESFNFRKLERLLKRRQQ